MPPFPRFCFALMLLLAAFAFCSPAARAADAPAAATESAPPPTDFWSQPNLLGDADGWRTQLGDTGWQPFATLMTELWDNTRGGIRNGMTNDLLLNFGGEADLAKLAGWDGAALRASFEWIQSNHPNHNTGALNPPTNIDASDQIRVYNLYLRQKLGQLTLKIGQIGADDDFAQTPGSGLFLNPGVTAPPNLYNQTLADGDAAVPHFPTDAPGIFARYDAKDLPIYTQLEVSLCDAGPDVSNNHGFDWRGSNGAMFAAEAGWNYHVAQLPGTVAVGGFQMDGRFTNWDSGAQERGIYGCYGFVTQTLVQSPGSDGGDPQPVITVFLFGGMAGPNNRVGPSADCASGINWNGPLPSRAKDVAGIALLHTRFSPDFTRSAFNPNGPGVTTAAETVVELTYQAVLAPWLNLQPDLQVIFNPANAGTRSTAVVIGARATLSF